MDKKTTKSRSAQKTPMPKTIAYGKKTTVTEDTSSNKNTAEKQKSAQSSKSTTKKHVTRKRRPVKQKGLAKVILWVKDHKVKLISFVVVIIVIIVLFGNNFIKFFNALSKKRQLQADIAAEKERGEKLDEELKEIGTKEYIEKIARECYKLVYPNEKIVITVPEEMINEKQTTSKNDEQNQEKEANNKGKDDTQDQKTDEKPKEEQNE